MPFEQSPKPEFGESERALIALLRKKGADDSEAKTALLMWCEKEEAEATKENTSRANIEVQLKRARVYRAAGGYDSALDTLEVVRQAASSDPSAGDLDKQALAMMDEIEAERGM